MVKQLRSRQSERGERFSGGKNADALVLGERLAAHLLEELAKARAVREELTGWLVRRLGSDDRRVGEVEVLQEWDGVSARCLDRIDHWSLP